MCVKRSKMTMLLNSFLNRIDYNNLNHFSYDINAQGSGRRRITGKDLMKQNVERESHRLRIHNRHIIDLATNYIWSSRLTPFQKNQFINLAKDANSANDINQDREISRIRRINVNNTETIDRIARIATPQVTDNPFENNFFNGTSFHGSDSFESLILPAGTFISTSFVS